MATRRCITAIFGLFDASGYSRPKEWSRLDANAIVGVWMRILNVEDDVAIAATESYLRTGGAFWPKPAEILACIPGRPADKGDRWSEVWDVIRGALGTWGRDRPPNDTDRRLSEDEEMHQAAMYAMPALGSWRDLCLSRTDALHFVAVKFEKAFRAAISSGAKREEFKLLDMTGELQRRIGEVGR